MDLQIPCQSNSKSCAYVDIAHFLSAFADFVYILPILSANGYVRFLSFISGSYQKTEAIGISRVDF